MEYISEIVTLGLIFGVPALIFLWAAVSVIRFRKRDRQDKQQCRSRKIMLILSVSAAGIMGVSILVLLILLMQSLAHM
ncbi:MAG: hypothetical protein IKQ39_05975 [Oscillospiraceae bacterium]|nr:hypothetical protein [Oscillospiraceae bacterium]